MDIEEASDRIFNLKIHATVLDGCDTFINIRFRWSEEETIVDIANTDYSGSNEQTGIQTALFQTTGFEVSLQQFEEILRTLFQPIYRAV